MGGIVGLSSTLFVKIIYGEVSYFSIIGMYCGLIMCIFIIDIIEKNKKIKKIIV